MLSNNHATNYDEAVRKAYQNIVVIDLQNNKLFSSIGSHDSITIKIIYLYKCDSDALTPNELMERLLQKTKHIDNKKTDYYKCE
jgi:hypothetical protein